MQLLKSLRNNELLLDNPQAVKFKENFSTKLEKATETAPLEIILDPTVRTFTNATTPAQLENDIITATNRPAWLLLNISTINNTNENKEIVNNITEIAIKHSIPLYIISRSASILKQSIQDYYYHQICYKS